MILVVSPNFDWQTTFSQSARADERHTTLSTTIFIRQIRHIFFRCSLSVRRVRIVVHSWERKTFWTRGCHYTFLACGRRILPPGEMSVYKWVQCFWSASGTQCLFLNARLRWRLLLYLIFKHNICLSGTFSAQCNYVLWKYVNYTKKT